LSDDQIAIRREEFAWTNITNNGQGPRDESCLLQSNSSGITVVLARDLAENLVAATYIRQNYCGAQFALREI
jgi:hypothetical protein